MLGLDSYLRTSNVAESLSRAPATEDKYRRSNPRPPPLPPASSPGPSSVEGGAGAAVCDEDIQLQEQVLSNVQYIHCVCMVILYI